MASLVAALSKVEVLSVPVRVDNTRLALDIDTGACANVLALTSYHELQRKFPHRKFKWRPSNAELEGVSGTQLSIKGMVTLPLRFSRRGTPFYADFYIVQQFNLPADGLLGLPTLRKNMIDVHPRNNSVTFKGVSYTAMSHSEPMLTARTKVLSTNPIKRKADHASEISLDLNHTPSQRDYSSKSWKIVPAILKSTLHYQNEEFTNATIL